MNRKQRREAARLAEVKKQQAQDFVLRMRVAREAKTARELFLNRGVKLVALPDAATKAAVAKWQASRSRRLHRSV